MPHDAPGLKTIPEMPKKERDGSEGTGTVSEMSQPLVSAGG